jgi:hypothetical protein
MYLFAKAKFELKRIAAACSSRDPYVRVVASMWTRVVVVGEWAGFLESGLDTS